MSVNIKTSVYVMCILDLNLIAILLLLMGINLYGLTASDIWAFT